MYEHRLVWLNHIHVFVTDFPFQRLLAETYAYLDKHTKSSNIEWDIKKCNLISIDGTIYIGKELQVWAIINAGKLEINIEGQSLKLTIDKSFGSSIC